MSLASYLILGVFVLAIIGMFVAVYQEEKKEKEFQKRCREIEDKIMRGDYNDKPRFKRWANKP